MMKNKTSTPVMDEQVIIACSGLDDPNAAYQAQLRNLDCYINTKGKLVVHASTYDGNFYAAAPIKDIVEQLTDKNKKYLLNLLTESNNKGE